MESITYLKNISIPPKKLRLLLPAIKRMSPAEALETLHYMQSHPARLYYKAIHSALSNARQTLKVDDNSIEFKLFAIEQGHVLKRYHPGSKGTAKPYVKRLSHIKIILRVKEAPKKSDKKIIAGEKTVSKEAVNTTVKESQSVAEPKVKAEKKLKVAKVIKKKT